MSLSTRPPPPAAALPGHAQAATNMASTADPRRVVGERVHALALHVTSAADCAARFGTRKDVALVSGTVKEVRIDKSGPRANTFVMVDFEFEGGNCTSKELNLRSVRAGNAPEATPTEAPSAAAAESPTPPVDRKPMVALEGHLTPTKRRKVLNGKQTSFAYQSRCTVCKKSVSTYICSQCALENPNGKQIHICHSKTEKLCFANHMNDVHRKQLTAPKSATPADGHPTSAVDAHLTPTKRRKILNGKQTGFAYQSRCTVCKKSVSTYICSQCKIDTPDRKDVHICHSKTGKPCFANHVSMVHRK